MNKHYIGKLNNTISSSFDEENFRYLKLPSEVAPEPTSEELFEQHKRILDEMKEVYKHKNNAYGNSFDKSIDKAGVISGYTRISDKFNRFDSYVFDNKFYEGDESILDTLLDLSNYAIMMYMWLRRQAEWEKEKDKEVEAKAVKLPTNDSFHEF